jgi:phosphomevalonate kinase
MTPARDAGPAVWSAVQAPGKVFLAGEYGVLLGAPALLMAVDRHVRVFGGVGAPVEDALVRAVIDHVRSTEGLDPPAAAPEVADEDFRLEGGGKLGLGSSAAKAAALTASLFARGGADLDAPVTRRRVLEVAWRAHRIAGGGSGADVAASVLGGVLRFEAEAGSREAALRALADRGPAAPGDAARTPFRAEGRDVDPRRLPLVVHGGAPVSSRAALARLGEGLRRAPGRFGGLLADVETAGTALVDALCDPGRGDEAVVAAVASAAERLAALAAALELGAGAGTEALGAADAVARRHGGAAKPSGAGGGDLILVFVPGLEEEFREAVVSDLDNAGLHVLQVALDTGGVRPYSRAQRS